MFQLPGDQLMKPLIATLLTLQLANATSYSSTATGTNWSQSTHWSPTGVPGDGDCVSIGHDTIINQNIGTAGNGIRNIVMSAGALTVSNAAARTIIFGSIGTNPIGGGSAAAPDCATATMFGFFNSYSGTINIVGSSTNRVTITTGNGTSPWYFYNQMAGFNFAFQYVDTLHMGTSNTCAAACAVNFRGLEFGLGFQNFTASIDHNTFTDYYQLIALGVDDTTYAINFNTFTGGRANGTAGHISGAGRSAPALSISDNTLTAPVNDAYFIILNAYPNGSTIARNALLGTTSAAVSLGFIGAGTGHSILNNVVINAKTSSGLPCIVVEANSSVVQGNYCAGQFAQGVEFNNTTSLEVTGNFLSQEQYAWFAQGLLFASSPASSNLHGNVMVNETDNASNSLEGMLLWNTNVNSNLINHNTILNAPCVTGAARGLSSLAISLGEPGATGTGNIAKNNVICGYVSGYADDANVAYAADFATVGVHHNAYYNNTNNFFSPTNGHGNGEANFWDGVNGHPSSTYGELSSASSVQFFAPTRRITTWDGVLGGPGTTANVFSEMAKRSGVGGIYNAAYNVSSLVSYTLQGFKPLTTSLGSVASDGSTIGAMAVVNGTRTVAGRARTAGRSR